MTMINGMCMPSLAGYLTKDSNDVVAFSNCIIGSFGLPYSYVLECFTHAGLEP